MNRIVLGFVLVVALVAALVVWLFAPSGEHAPPASPPSVASSPVEAKTDSLTLSQTEERERVSSSESAPIPISAEPAQPAAQVADSAPRATTATEDPGRIFGRVARPDGSDAVDRKVQFLRLPGGPKHSPTTDEHGRFDQRGLVPGKWYISTVPSRQELDALGYPKDTLDLEFASLRVIELAPGAEVEIELGVPSKDAIHVTGRIHADPLPKMIALQWWPAGEAAYSRSKWKRTSPDGTYEMFLDEPGQYEVSLAWSGTSSIIRTVDVPSVREFRQDFELGSTNITGRLRTASGEPIATAWVELTPRAGHRPMNIMPYLTCKVRTEADGRFGFELVSPAKYVLTAHDGRSKSEGDAAALVVRDISITDGSESLDLDLVVELGQVLRGRVMRDAKVAKLVAVFVFDDRGEPVNPVVASACDQKGNFTLPALAPGRYTLIGARYREWTDPLIVDVGAKEPERLVELTLRDAAVLEVEGLELGDAWIDVRDEAGNCLSAVRDPSQQLMAEVATGPRDPSRWRYFVPAGSYAIRAMGSTGVVASARVSATPGETRHVTLAR